ncbi:MAG: hypothetical protein PHZ02_09745 [Desulfocapsaceae bacterium]|nr:hypothetical protein [Desulfocapsaceae bacterium]
MPLSLKEAVVTLVCARVLTIAILAARTGERSETTDNGKGSDCRAV